jgi:hypothetical protein
MFRPGPNMYGSITNINVRNGASRWFYYKNKKGLGRFVTAHSEDICFMVGYVFRKPKLGSVDSFGPTFAPD